MNSKLDHFIGLNCNVDISIHPNGENFLYSSGSNIVVSNLMSPSNNRIISLHDDFISALALSNSGSVIATGQRGINSNVIVYDLTAEAALFLFEEHDQCVQNLAFTLDDRILVTVGGCEDNKIFFLDMSNGYIVASSKVPVGTTCVAVGGFVKDIKRRDTDKYLIATAGSSGILLWALDPFEGQLETVPILGDPRATITRHVTAISFSNDYEYLFASTTSGNRDPYEYNAL